ncbi:MAG TPA: hypothetical protein VN224_11885, partial [Xanthomonadales bacterium]|nr:hypothetical protein [Xanthomonadales bacterium]
MHQRSNGRSHLFALYQGDDGLEEGRLVDALGRVEDEERRMSQELRVRIAALVRAPRCDARSVERVFRRRGISQPKKLRVRVRNRPEIRIRRAERSSASGIDDWAKPPLQSWREGLLEKTDVVETTFIVAVHPREQCAVGGDIRAVQRQRVGAPQQLVEDDDKALVLTPIGCLVRVDVMKRLVLAEAAADNQPCFGSQRPCRSETPFHSVDPGAKVQKRRARRGRPLREAVKSLVDEPVGLSAATGVVICGRQQHERCGALVLGRRGRQTIVDGFGLTDERCPIHRKRTEGYRRDPDVRKTRELRAAEPLDDPLVLTQRNGCGGIWRRGVDDRGRSFDITLIERDVSSFDVRCLAGQCAQCSFVQCLDDGREPVFHDLGDRRVNRSVALSERDER